tara:strand:+ start:443 stop:625 length:183 start_codon:yes stop_codon:yes gene_type:complete
MGRRKIKSVDSSHFSYAEIKTTKKTYECNLSEAEKLMNHLDAKGTQYNVQLKYKLDKYLK